MWAKKNHDGTSTNYTVWGWIRCRQCWSRTCLSVVEREWPCVHTWGEKLRTDFCKTAILRVVWSHSWMKMSFRINYQKQWLLRDRYSTNEEKILTRTMQWRWTQFANTSPRFGCLHPFEIRGDAKSSVVASGLGDLHGSFAEVDRVMIERGGL